MTSIVAHDRHQRFCDHWAVRWVVPWLLLGVLGLVTGLGLGLGLAYGGTEATQSATPRPIALSPTWVPPGTGQSGLGVGIILFAPPHCPYKPARTVSSPDHTQSFTYLTASCPFGTQGETRTTHVGFYRVTLAGTALTLGPTGILIATWRELPGTYVVVAGVRVTQAQVKRFILGLVPAPGYPDPLYRRVIH
jgi:hypothetical protein